MEIDPPFRMSDAIPMRQLLLDNYIKPAATWLLGPETSKGVLPQAVGSPWECAFAIMVLVHLHEHLVCDKALSDSDSHLKEKIEKK